jgi:small ligand-binding sensory domain FIST
MRFHGSLAATDDLETSCRAVAASIRAGLGEGPIDLCVVFATTELGPQLDRVPVLLHELLGCRALVGCTGQALVGDGRVVGDTPAIAVLAGRMPDVQIDTIHIGNGDLPDPDAPPTAWRDLLPAAVAARRGLIVLSEPFHCDTRALLAGLDYGWPDVPKLGGIASGSRHPEGHVLFAGRTTHRQGAVVLSLAGGVQVTPVVSQGCRPIGRPGRITKADRNRLVAVDDTSARQYVERQLASLGTGDLDLARHGPLFLGIACDPFADHDATAGDFLVRNIFGLDPDSGSLLVGDQLTVGRQIQLHLRDRASSEQDLQLRLHAAQPGSATGALMFRCLGREGRDHRRFAAAAPGVPLVGFHCNGEIGPVGASTYMHGYTASFALFQPLGTNAR